MPKCPLTPEQRIEYAALLTAKRKMLGEHYVARQLAWLKTGDA